MKAELIDHMGSDLTVVNSARVSFNKHTEEFTNDDERLIAYLARHNHFTPFTHPQITVREKVPIFVARQRFKHVIGFTYNEVSRRYVDDDPEFFIPDAWRARPDKSMKQGSGDNLPDDVAMRADDRHNRAIERCLDAYQGLLHDGVAPEQARMVLPQSMYTEYYVTGSLAAWARAYNLRIDAHAQKEIQGLAKQWGDIIAPLFPASWAALTQP